MPTQEIPMQSSTANTVDAIWTLIQCQTKSVQRALTKRFVALDAEQRAQRSKANTITPELQTRLDAARKDIQEGHGTVCKTQEELHAFLSSL